MGRKPRIYFPGAFYHLLNRGNRRQLLFHDEQDYLAFLGGLSETAHRYQLRIHAYCMMPNHFHLLAEVDLFSPALAMRSLETLLAIMKICGFLNKSRQLKTWPHKASIECPNWP